MSIEKAQVFFQGSERLNCAQAIAKAFEEEFNAPPEWVKGFAAYGNGRAPQGRCGALHAARALLGEGATAEALERRFIDLAGSAQCRDIRRARRLTCADCVEAAARLLQENQAQSPSP